MSTIPALTPALPSPWRSQLLALRRADLNLAHLAVLESIAQADPDPAQLEDITRSLKFSLPYISLLAKALHRRGLIHKSRPGWYVHLRLTAAGRSTLAKLSP